MTDEELKGLFESMRKDTAERFDGVQKQFDAMRKEMADRFKETADRFDGVGKQFDGVGKQFDGVQKQFASMREENAAAHAVTRQHFDASLERLEHRVDFLAETVQLVNENQRSTAVALDEKIDRTTKETQGLIRFVNDGLHRRVLVLEEKAASKK